MNRALCIKAVVLVIATLAVLGCKSKQETPAASGGAPQKSEAIKSISGQTASGATVTSPKRQMESGDFATMYTEASPGFQKIGSQAAFVGKFEQTRQKTGPFSGPAQETSIVTLPDLSHVLIYRVENDRFKSERRLTFARAKDGKMQLAGLNQHDEPKRVAGK